MRPVQLILTCEHGTNHIPKTLQHLFSSDANVLSSTKAMDLGTQALSLYLANKLNCELFNAFVSRLLVDANRSLRHPNCLSDYTRALSSDERTQLTEQYYKPYRLQVIDRINEMIKSNSQVLHISVHSFQSSDTNNEDVVLGLLYDPSRHGEKEVIRVWRNIMMNQLTPLRVRLNYPYKNRPQSFTAFLKRHYPECDYLGVELELNQRYIKDETSFASIKELLGRSLEQLMELL